LGVDCGHGSNFVSERRAFIQAGSAAAAAKRQKDVKEHTRQEMH
jgi:hypothetical protein